MAVMTRLGALLALAACLAAVPGSRADATPARQAIACAFGEKLIREARDDWGAKQPPRFRREIILNGEPIRPAWLGGSLDPVVRAWEESAPGNLFTACPHLKKLLPTNVRFATPQDWEDVRRIPITRDVHIIGWGAPFVSRDGKVLILHHQFHCPGLCGGRFVMKFTRQRNGWSKGEPISMTMS